MTNTKQTEQTTKSPWLMKYLAVLAIAVALVMLPYALPVSTTGAYALRGLAVAVWAGGSLYIFLGESIREKIASMYPQPIPTERPRETQRTQERRA